MTFEFCYKFLVSSYNNKFGVFADFEGKSVKINDFPFNKMYVCVYLKKTKTCNEAKHQGIEKWFV